MKAAYRSSKPEVLAAWKAWLDHVNEVKERRRAYGDQYGRNLMVQGSAMAAGGNHVTGLEAFESDIERYEQAKRMGTTPELLGEKGEFRLRAQRPRMYIPNTRRKSGEECARYLHTLRQEGHNLPGMPGFALLGMYITSPAIFRHKRTIWAYWGEQPTANEDGLQNDPIDPTLWTPAKLSAYYLAREAVEEEQRD